MKYSFLVLVFFLSACASNDQTGGKSFMQSLGEALSKAGAPAPQTTTTTCNKVGDTIVCRSSQ